MCRIQLSVETRRLAYRPAPIYKFGFESFDGSSESEFFVFHVRIESLSKSIVH